MTAVPEPRVQVTSYTVSCLPEGTRHWDLTVTYRGGGRWAVLDGTHRLSVDSTWDWDYVPDEGRDEWLARHSFDLDTALRLAKERAPHVVVNGITVEQALERFARGQQ